MPSHLHESHLLLFRNQPALAAKLIREALGVPLPEFGEARVESADLTELQPAEYRADLVIQLCRDAPIYGIVVEVQLSEDDDKPYTWPAYVSNLRRRLRCPVSLLVVTPNESVARWAARRIEMGGDHFFRPYVLSPSQVPEIADEALARENPELAVLSAMAHGQDADQARAMEIALAAQGASVGLDADRNKIYLDLILNSLGEAAREALVQMNARKYEYQSDFARHYIAVGRAEGFAELILQQLASRFGSVGAEVESRVKQLPVAELSALGERLLSAQTLEEVLT